MEIRSTETTPTRYAAQETHGILWENANPQHQGGFEWAAYHDDRLNGEVVSYQGKSFLVDIQSAVARNHHGGWVWARIYTRNFATYQQAFAALHLELRLAAEKLKELA